MRRINIIPFGLICFLFGCMNDELTIKQEFDNCAIENAIKEKDTAKNLIIGKWNWLNTTYIIRGTGITIQTPESTNQQMIFEFTEDKVKIFSNGDLTSELDYKVQFWREGTTSVNEKLVVQYDSGETSILFLNFSGTCLRLVNSYNDAGGDVTLEKI